MRLNSCFIVIAYIILTLKVVATDLPLLQEARSKTVLPSVFIIEDSKGASVDFPEWIKTAVNQYYIEASDLLKKEIADNKDKSEVPATELERALSQFEADSKRGLLPRWVENIFIVHKGSEAIVSFFAKSGGWIGGENSASLAFTYTPAYVVIIDAKTGRLNNTKNNLKAAVYVDLYQKMADAGIKTDYRQKAGIVAPLNPSSPLLGEQPKDNNRPQANQ